MLTDCGENREAKIVSFIFIGAVIIVFFGLFYLMLVFMSKLIYFILKHGGYSMNSNLHQALSDQQIDDLAKRILKPRCDKIDLPFDEFYAQHAKWLRNWIKEDMPIDEDRDDWRIQVLFMDVKIAIKKAILN